MVQATFSSLKLLHMRSLEMFSATADARSPNCEKKPIGCRRATGAPIAGAKIALEGFLWVAKLFSIVFRGSYHKWALKWVQAKIYPETYI
jgi:hypothetical protein